MSGVVYVLPLHDTSSKASTSADYKTLISENGDNVLRKKRLKQLGGGGVVATVVAATVALLVVLRLQGAGEGDTEDRGTTSAPPGTPTAPTEMLIQKRVRGGPKENFARTFAEYEEGFSSHGEVWLGLAELHKVTSNGSWGLLVKLTDWNDKIYWAYYDRFQVGRGPGYRLDISGFNPREARLEDQLKLGDGLTYTSSNHITHGMSFSARDRDQDPWRGSCSVEHSGSGGWWYNQCGVVRPNGWGSDTMQTQGYKYIGWQYGGERGTTWNSWAASQLIIVRRDH